MLNVLLVNMSLYYSIICHIISYVIGGAYLHGRSRSEGAGNDKNDKNDDNSNQ